MTYQARTQRPAGKSGRPPPQARQDTPRGAPRGTGPRAPPTWTVGDIAFLRSADTMNKKDYQQLIASGYLPEKATCHPVIVLGIDATTKRTIVTPVSAFSIEANGYLPPWKQQYHRAKNPGHFRAFVGTARPDNKHASLRLADDKMQMPKPQASWVFIRHFFCVPFTVLGWFNKAPTLLRVHPESVQQLKNDMKQGFKKESDDAGARLHAAEVEDMDMGGRQRPAVGNVKMGGQRGVGNVKMGGKRGPAVVNVNMGGRKRPAVGNLDTLCADVKDLRL